MNMLLKREQNSNSKAIATKSLFSHRLNLITFATLLLAKNEPCFLSFILFLSLFLSNQVSIHYECVWGDTDPLFLTPLYDIIGYYILARMWWNALIFHVCMYVGYSIRNSFAPDIKIRKFRWARHFQQPINKKLF